VIFNYENVIFHVARIQDAHTPSLIELDYSQRLLCGGNLITKRCSHALLLLPGPLPGYLFNEEKSSL